MCFNKTEMFNLLALFLRKFKIYILQKYVECPILFGGYYPLQRTFTSVIQ